MGEGLRPVTRLPRPARQAVPLRADRPATGSARARGSARRRSRGSRARARPGALRAASSRPERWSASRSSRTRSPGTSAPSTSRDAKMLADFAAVGVRNGRRMLALQRLGLRDRDTAAYNLSYFTDYASKEIYKARRYGRTFSLLTFSHRQPAAGPAAAGRGGRAQGARAAIIRALSKIIRDSDVIAKATDQEFYLLLPETDFFGALMFLRRALAAVREEPEVQEVEARLPLALVGRRGDLPQGRRGLRRAGAPLPPPHGRAPRLAAAQAACWTGCRSGTRWSCCWAAPQSPKLPVGRARRAVAPRQGGRRALRRAAGGDRPRAAARSRRRAACSTWAGRRCARTCRSRSGWRRAPPDFALARLRAGPPRGSRVAPGAHPGVPRRATSGSAGTSSSSGSPRAPPTRCIQRRGPRRHLGLPHLRHRGGGRAHLQAAGRVRPAALLTSAPWPRPRKILIADPDLEAVRALTRALRAARLPGALRAGRLARARGRGAAPPGPHRCSTRTARCSTRDLHPDPPHQPAHRGHPGGAHHRRARRRTRLRGLRDG